MTEESNNDRQYRHSLHRELMEWQKECKVRARERHKLNHGRKLRCPGNLY